MSMQTINIPVGNYANVKSIQDLQNTFRNQKAPKEDIRIGESAAVCSVSRMLRPETLKERNALFSQNYLKDNKSYAESLRESRQKASDTNLALKKLKYNFKSISSKLIQSKTSASAKQVAAAAAREVLRLKRQKQNGDADGEELDAAITHAKAMERLARKKARHLEEEELSKIGGVCQGELEEREELKEEIADKTDELKETIKDALFEGESFELPEKDSDDMAEEMSEVASEEMEESLDDMNESVKDLMDEMGLTDLLDSLEGTYEDVHDPEELKMMKIKHRNKEMKDLAKADSEYLKVIFDQLGKAMTNAANSPIIDASV